MQATYLQRMIYRLVYAANKLEGDAKKLANELKKEAKIALTKIEDGEKAITKKNERPWR